MIQRAAWPDEVSLRDIMYRNHTAFEHAVAFVRAAGVSISLVNEEVYVRPYMCVYVCASTHACVHECVDVCTHCLLFLVSFYLHIIVNTV